MTTFQNRYNALTTLGGEEKRYPIINIYGEHGVGKTRLIQEYIEKNRAKSPTTLTLLWDMSSFFKDVPNKPEAFLRDLFKRASGWLTGGWTKDFNMATASVVNQLLGFPENRGVCLIFDTTEAFQEDMEFWAWLEEFFISPLIGSQVQLIFSGRVPVPWRRAEVKRAVKLYQLEHLEIEPDAQNLVKECLIAHGLPDNDPSMKQAIDFVLDFTFGHPLLSERLTEYVAPRWLEAFPEELKTLRLSAAQDCVKKFIDEEFLEHVENPWKEILWWASVLDWFDLTILRDYIERADPDLVKDKTLDFYIRGVPRLRIQNTIIWRAEQGDQLYGVVGQIMRHCLQISDPERFAKANQIAADTMDAQANFFPKDDTDADLYRNEALKYRGRIS